MSKRSVVTTLVASTLVAGCGSDAPPFPGPGTESTCHVSATSPAFDETGVSVAAPITISWSEPVDFESIASKVDLKRLGGPNVPFDLEPVGPETVVLQPSESLWFWGEYALTVGGVTSAEGELCEGEDIAFSTLDPSVLSRALRPAAADAVAKIGDHVIAVSGSYRGLQIYDVTTPQTTQLVGEVPTEESPISLSVLGDRAYAPAGNRGVLIFDVTSPATPVLIGRAGTPGHALDAAPFVHGNKLVLAVADYAEGVRLIDVTDAAGPKDLGSIAPAGPHGTHTWGVDVQGTLLAIADGVGGLALADLSDLDEPMVLSYVADDYDLYDVALAGTIAYTSRGPLGVRAWNIAVPASPIPLANLPGPTTTALDRIQRLVVDSGELLAATGSVGVERVMLDGSGGMALAAVHDVPGRAWSVAVDADYIYAGAEAGLVIYERAAPTGAPAVWFDPHGHGLAREVAVDSNRAYVAAGSRGLQTFAVDDPATTELLDQDDTPGMSLDVAAGTILTHDDLILLGDMRAGIVLYDRSTPDNPVPIGFIDSEDTVQGMQVVDSTLYACDGNIGMFIADIASPAAPIVLARQMFPPDLIGCSDLVVIGDIALLGTQGGLGIVDVTDPASPAWLGWSEMSELGSIQYIRRVGDHLLTTFRIEDYEGTYHVSHELLVFDIGDPLAPELVWASGDLGSNVGEIVVTGDIAFVAGGDQGVLVFHIADIESPQLEGAIATQGNAHGIAVHGQTLHVAQANGGLVAAGVGALPE
jgi:hypothetical protein